METKLLNCEEAAIYLGLPVSRVRYETFVKRIPHVKIGRSVRFSKEQLDEWINILSVKCGEPRDGRL